MNHNTNYILDKNIRFIFAFLHISEVNILKKAGLPADFFNRKVLSLSTEKYYNLWTAIVEDTNSDIPIPLMMEKLPLFAGISVPIMAALCSPNFITFAQRIRKYKPLIGPLKLNLDESEENFCLSFKHVDDTQKLHPLIVASEFVFFTKILRDATQKRIIPQSLRSQEVFNNHAAYYEYFGTEVLPSNENTMIFAKRDALLPFAMADDSVWKHFEPSLNQHLHELEVDSTIAARVRSILVEQMPIGTCSIDSVSKELCMSSRTLQRRLKNEKTHFQQQLNHSREILAKHYLSNSELNIAEISFLLAYEEPSSFSRAFHLWTGMAPETYRSVHPQ